LLSAHFRLVSEILSALFSPAFAELLPCLRSADRCSLSLLNLSDSNFVRSFFDLLSARLRSASSSLSHFFLLYFGPNLLCTAVALALLFNRSTIALILLFNRSEIALQSL
jgi:hypothetical protein